MEVMKSSIIYQNDELEPLCELCQEDMGTEDNPVMSITSQEKEGYCNHTMCSVCVKNYVDNKINHGEIPNCPWCSRVIVGIEKALTANKYAVGQRTLLEKKEETLKKHLEVIRSKDEEFEKIKSQAKDKELALQKLKTMQQEYENENKNLKKRLELAERERAEKKALEIQIAEAKIRDEALSKKIEAIELEKEEYQNQIKVLSISQSNLEQQHVENGMEDVNSDSGVGWSEWLVGSYIAPMTKKLINVASNQVLGYDSFGAAGEHVVKARIQLLERRGRRRDSNVFHAKSEDRIFGLTEVAIKKVKLPIHIYQPNVNVGEAEDFSLSVKKNSAFYSCFREAMIMSSLKHTHIMKFLGASREQGCLNIIMPYVGCDLEYYSYGTADSYFSLPQIQQISYALLSALNYLHSANIVHRDIRLSSILIKMSDEPELDRREIISIKLSNFQHAHSLIEPFLDPVSVNSQPNGLQSVKKFPKTLSSIFSMAPEVSLVDYFDYFVQNFDWKAADIWALGNALATLVRGGKPYFCKSEPNNIENLVSDHIEKNILIKECRPEREILNQMLGVGFPVQKKWSSELISISKDVLRKGSELPGKKKLLLTLVPDSLGLEDLIAQMIHFNPQSRKTCSFLLQNRFFSGYKPKNHSESSQEWVSKSYPFSDKSLYSFAEKCGGDATI